ncbi:hypothetical protein B0813_002217 [Candidatus Fervidibacteria bacterium JGI MDM2 SSWTFF-3-K9]
MIFGGRVSARRKEGQESEIKVRIWMLKEMLDMDGMRRWDIWH